MLRYESNGGTEYADERHAENSTVQLEKTPVRKGRTFTGWYADKALTQKVTSIQMTSDKTVYAGWKAVEKPSSGPDSTSDQGIPHTGDSGMVIPLILLGAGSLILLLSIRKRCIR